MLIKIPSICLCLEIVYFIIKNIIVAKLYNSLNDHMCALYLKLINILHVPWKVVCALLQNFFP